MGKFLQIVFLLPAAALLAGCPVLNPFLTPPESAFEGTPVRGEAPLTVLFSDMSEAGTTNITEWQWDFGDGTTSTLRNPSHIYTLPGSYSVSLTVTTSVGTDTSVRRDYIQAVASPVADFTATPVEGGTPLAVSFTDTSEPGSAPITAWEWNFGDRSPLGTTQHPAHTYTAPGQYTVSLKVTTAAGTDTETKVRLVNVSGAPIADFSASYTPGVAPLSVTFRDESEVGTATIIGRTWDFGDGNQSNEINPAHTYSAAGSYTVSLAIQTTAGSDQEVKVGFIIVEQGPTAAFTGEPVTGPAPLTVIFTDQSLPGSRPIIGHLWNFGDGGLLSTLANPARTYTAPGTYSVSLRVTTAAGPNTLVMPDYITVTAPDAKATDGDGPTEFESALATDGSGGSWVVVEDESGTYLVRFDETGAPLWRRALDVSLFFGPRALFAPGDGTVCITGVRDFATWLARFDGDGLALWETGIDDGLDIVESGLDGTEPARLLLERTEGEADGRGGLLHQSRWNLSGVMDGGPVATWSASREGRKTITIRE